MYTQILLSLPKKKTCVQLIQEPGEVCPVFLNLLFINVLKIIELYVMWIVSFSFDILEY